MASGEGFSFPPFSNVVTQELVIYQGWKELQEAIEFSPSDSRSCEFKGFEAAAFSVNWIVCVDKQHDCIVFVFLSSCLLGS